MYDNTIPMILTNKFGMSQAWSGAIMALDNVLALFMLPLFGAISDEHHSRSGAAGRPFIVVGTPVAVAAFVGLSLPLSMQLDSASAPSPPSAEPRFSGRSTTPRGRRRWRPRMGRASDRDERFTREERCGTPSQLAYADGQLRAAAGAQYAPSRRSSPLGSGRTPRSTVDGAAVTNPRLHGLRGAGPAGLRLGRQAVRKPRRRWCCFIALLLVMRWCPWRRSAARRWR